MGFFFIKNNNNSNRWYHKGMGVLYDWHTPLPYYFLFCSPACLRHMKRGNTIGCAEEARGVGMHFVMAASQGDKAARERFDLTLTWIQWLKPFSSQENLNNRSVEQVRCASVLFCVSTLVWTKFAEGGMESN